MYSDETKYTSENDAFQYKLIMFHDACSRVDISFEARRKTLFLMLKESAFDYYYSNACKASTFDDVCFEIRAYFEN